MDTRFSRDSLPWDGQNLFGPMGSFNGSLTILNFQCRSDSAQVSSLYNSGNGDFAYIHFLRIGGQGLERPVRK